jgi:hypothetical protein
MQHSSIFHALHAQLESRKHYITVNTYFVLLIKTLASAISLYGVVNILTLSSLLLRSAVGGVI